MEITALIGGGAPKIVSAAAPRWQHHRDHIKFFIVGTACQFTLIGVAEKAADKRQCVTVLLDSPDIGEYSKITVGVSEERRELSIRSRFDRKKEGVLAGARMNETLPRTAVRFLEKYRRCHVLADLFRWRLDPVPLDNRLFKPPDDLPATVR